MKCMFFWLLQGWPITVQFGKKRSSEILAISDNTQKETLNKDIHVYKKIKILNIFSISVLNILTLRRLNAFEVAMIAPLVFT